MEVSIKKTKRRSLRSPWEVFCWKRTSTVKFERAISILKNVTEKRRCCICWKTICVLCSKCFKGIKNLSWKDDPDNVKGRETIILGLLLVKYMLFLKNGWAKEPGRDLLNSMSEFSFVNITQCEALKNITPSFNQLLLYFPGDKTCPSSFHS